MTDLDATQQFYLERGFSQSLGFGRWPAILVVDVIEAFTNPSSPLGSHLDAVVMAICRLLDSARPRNVPIIFTTVAYGEDIRQPARLFMTKVPSLSVLKTGTPAVAVDARLARQPAEPVLVKQFASAFFGTALSSLLVTEGCDTVIVTGCTTSGCVRASVVDALQYGFRPIVPLEAVGDRASVPHHANLFDIQAKYGDVVALDEVLEYLQNFPITPKTIE